MCDGELWLMLLDRRMTTVAVGINRPEPNAYHGRSFGSMLLTGRKKREPTILYCIHERRQLEPRRCRYKRTTRLNIMLERWSTVGGGGPRTVRRRHPSVPTGDCGPRLESVTRLDQMIDFRKWIFLLVFCSRFHTPDTTRGHSVYHRGYTAGHKLFLYLIIYPLGMSIQRYKHGK